MQRIYNEAMERVRKMAGFAQYEDNDTVVAYYREKALAGDAGAQCIMGVLCCIGIGTKEAPEYIPPGAKDYDHRHLAADGTLLWAVGDDYLDVIGEHQSFVKAAQWFALAAEQKHPWGLILLGDCFSSAEGVAEDQDKALKCYHYATQCGNADAMWRTGQMHYTEHSTEQDFDTAFKWYEQAAITGNRNALWRLGECFRYGEGVEKNLEVAYLYYRESALRGSGFGLYRYADCHYYGYGAKQSYNLAAKLYKKSADLEDEWGQCSYGICCYMGEGVPVDRELAMKYYARSAKHGCYDAFWRLGDGYRDGIGVQRNIRHAAELYRQAIRQCKNESSGLYTAKQRLGSLLLTEMKPTSKNKKEGLALLEDAAAHNNEEATYELARCYKRGCAVEKDLYKAAQLYENFLSLTDNLCKWLYGVDSEADETTGEHDEDIVNSYYEVVLSQRLNAMDFLSTYYGSYHSDTKKQLSFLEMMVETVQRYGLYLDGFPMEEKGAKAIMKSLDTIRGCLLGGAVGDALGYPIEFWNEDRIFSHFGPQGASEYILKNGVAEISDDTQMTLYTANGLLFGKTRGMMRGIMGACSDYIGMCYRDWLKTQERCSGQGVDTISWLNTVPELHSCRAPGMTCLSALGQRSLGTMEKPINNSKGCGGVMRVAPIALYFADDCHTDAEVDRIAAEAAALTHGHELGYIPAAMLVHIIRCVAYNRDVPLLTAVLDAKRAMKEAFPNAAHLLELLDLIDKAIQLAHSDKSDLESVKELGEGWVAEETLAIAVFCALRHEDDFEQAIIAAVSHSGDSDSTGAVTGNILGAYLGVDAIPERFLAPLELRNVVEEMALDLYNDCKIEENGDVEDPKWVRKYIYAGRKSE